MGTARLRRLVGTPLAAELLVLGAAAAFYGVFIARTAFRVGGDLFFGLFDDMMISMTYARNLAEGAGLVWNRGDDVEGYTNFLWTLWMAALHLTGLPDSKVALPVMISGAALLLGTAWLARCLALRLGAGRWLALAAAALVAFYYPLVYWTLRGGETGLLAFLTAALALLSLRLRAAPATRDLLAFAAVAAAGILTRTDFAVAAVVAAAYVAYVSRGHRRRIVLVLGGAIVGTLAAHTAFRLAYYGDPFPNTYYLKVYRASLLTRLERGLTALRVVESIHLFAPTILVAVYLATQRRRVPAGAFLLAALFGAQCAYSAYVGGDAWESMSYANRYLAQAVPMLLVVTVVAAATLLRPGAARGPALALATAFTALLALTQFNPIELGDGHFFAANTKRLSGSGVLLALLALIVYLDRVRRPSLRGVTIAAALLLVFTSANLHPLQGWWRDGGFYVGEDARMARYGLVLRRATEPDARIAVVWAGSIPYFARRYSIDLLGKSDRKIAHGPHRPEVGFLPGHTKFDYRYSVVALRPDIVAQRFFIPSGEERYFAGYVDVEPGWSILVRKDTTLVRRSVLEEHVERELARYRAERRRV